MKTKKCQNGSLYDLIVAADNLNAFMKLMFYLNKISLSGMVPETSNRGAFHISSGPGSKINKNNDINYKPENKINHDSHETNQPIIENKVKDNDTINNKPKIASNQEVTSAVENVKSTDIIKDDAQFKSSNQKSDTKNKKLDELESDNIKIDDLSLNNLPAINLKQPKKDENDGISFIEQMRRLDEIKQEKIASLMDKNINNNKINDEELMELRRDLQPIGVSKLKPISSDNDVNPLDKQKNRLDEIRNLINMNKKK